MKVWMLFSCLDSISNGNVNTCDMCYFDLLSPAQSSPSPFSASVLPGEG